MTIDTIVNVISECCNDVIFTYKGVSAGVTSEVINYIPIYQAWYGEAIKYYSDVNDVVNDKMYSGKSIIELINEVDFRFA